MNKRNSYSYLRSFKPSDGECRLSSVTSGWRLTMMVRHLRTGIHTFVKMVR